MESLYAKMRNLASGFASDMAALPGKISEKLAKIPTPSFKHSQKAIEVLKNDLATSGHVAICPVAGACLAFKSLVRLSSNRGSLRRNFSSCDKMVQSLSRELSPQSKERAEHVRKSFQSVQEKIKSGHSIDSLDTLNTLFSANCDDVHKVKKFAKLITSIKKNCNIIDKEKEETKDKIQAVGSIILGVLCIPALPLTLGLGVVYSVFSVADSLFTLATGKEFQLMPRAKAKLRRAPDNTLL